MMKKNFILYLAMSATYCATAQMPSATRMEQRRQAHDYLLSSLMSRPGSIAAQRPTAIEQRLIAIRLDDNIGEPLYRWDTTRLYYSGNRGSRFNRATCQFNTRVSAMNVPLAEGWALLPSAVDEVKPDSVIYQNMNGFSDRQVAAYRQQNLIRQCTYTYSGGSIPFSYVVGYDNGNHVQRVANYQGDNDTTDKRVLHYNAGFTRIVSDSSYYVGGNPALAPLSLWTYTYDSGDRITELENMRVEHDGHQIPRSLYYFTYYPDGRLQTIKSYAGTGAGYLPEYADSFTYDGTHAVYQGRYRQGYGGSGEPYTPTWERKHFNTAGLTDTIYYFVGGINPNPDVAVSYSVIEYNAFDNPVTQKVIQRGAANAFRVYRYYYEDYDTEVSVSGTLAEQGSISVYPNPFAGQFHVRWKGLQPLKNAHLQLTDYQGRIVCSWQQDLPAGEHTFKCKGQYATGNYLLVIRNEKGEKIVKKLVCQ